MASDAPITPEVVGAALSALRTLAREQPGYHRVPAADALIAAAAREAGFGVLHYDRHFERLGLALGVPTRWVWEPGSI